MPTLPLDLLLSYTETFSGVNNIRQFKRVDFIRFLWLDLVNRSLKYINIKNTKNKNTRKENSRDNQNCCRTKRQNKGI